MQPEAPKNQRVFITDCEGPISKNDNAFELTHCFVPDGDRFFALISKYDDVLADVVKKRDYKAGDTLRLILPFFKAYGVTNKKIKDFSARSVLLVPGAKETLTFVRQLMPSFIVSTSYEQYIFTLCMLTGFPFENTFCTHLNMDKYKLSLEEIKNLKKLKDEITELPLIEIPNNVDSVSDLSVDDQKTLARLDEIFWKKIPQMESGKMLRDVNPVGGVQKAAAVKDIVDKIGCGLDEVMYVGDSITDASALKLVKDHGGLAISFNGNRYSVEQSDIVVLSGNTIVSSVLAEVFSRMGKEGVLRLVDNWNLLGLKDFCVLPLLRKQMVRLFPANFPQVEQVTVENMDRLIRESSTFRKTVRGEAIGNLG